MKNNGEFLKVHVIEKSVATDEVILPKDFMKRLTAEEFFNMDFRYIKNKSLWIVKNDEIEFKLEKILGR
jgi:3-isopropylmalate dehydratase small subunit